MWGVMDREWLMVMLRYLIFGVYCIGLFIRVIGFGFMIFMVSV